MAYTLLNQFRSLFEGKPYKHRVSNQGDAVAACLFEDLFALKRSKKFCDAVTAQTHVANRQNTRFGTEQRRGDGTFGEKVPNEPAVVIPGLAVALGDVATIEIGAEVKIMAKAMIKQLDRVGSDLLHQVSEFKTHGDDPICVGIVAINRATAYTGYEGEKANPTTGKANMRHPIQEADEAEARLVARVKSKFDAFIILRFSVSNTAPYDDFAWTDIRDTEKEYASALLRISREYERRF